MAQPNLGPDCGPSLSDVAEPANLRAEACNCGNRDWRTKRTVWLRRPAFWSVMRADRSEVEGELSAEDGAVDNRVPRETAIGVILAERPVSAE